MPSWVPLGTLLACFLWLLTQLSADADARGVASIDATRFRLHAGGQWISEAWRSRLERVLLRVGQVDADDREALERLRAQILELSFVSAVGPAEVVWPDGLSLPVRLHQPVACVRVGDDFLPVAADGSVLAGYGYAPHEAYGGWLPALGPQGIRYPTMEPLQPGDVLRDPRHLDALAVACSMWGHASLADRRALGRCEIDASRRFGPWGKPGGVRINLEGARRILFGRVPGGDYPGELPEHLKWRNVSAALARSGAGGEAWDLFDARWDEPDFYRRSDLEGPRQTPAAE